MPPNVQQMQCECKVHNAINQNYVLSLHVEIKKLGIVAKRKWQYFCTHLALATKFEHQPSAWNQIWNGSHGHINPWLIYQDDGFQESILIRIWPVPQFKVWEVDMSFTWTSSKLNDSLSVPQALLLRRGGWKKSDTSAAQSDVLIFNSRSAIFAFKFIYIYTYIYIYIITYTRNYYVCSLLWYPYWPLLTRLPNVRTYTSVALGSRPVQHKVLTQRKKNMFRPCLQNIVFKKQTRAKLQPSSTHSKLLTQS